MPTPKTKTVKPVHANRGLEAKYRKALQDAIREMADSVEYWLKAEYRKNPPAMAVDASPVEIVRKALKGLAKRWTAKFEEWAPKLAEAYLEGQFKATDSAFRRALKDAGWAVDFRMTPQMRDAFNASLAENVGLIRSIPEQYLSKVEGVVMRHYATGRDLASMVDSLQDLYPAAAHRAELIARDQSNKANAVVQKARQLELGIVEAEWHHSHAGKTPRPDHVAAHKTRYKIAEGCLISGKYIYPGEEINCRCTCRSILPF